jgi:phosphatidylglycerophosphatase A
MIILAEQPSRDPHAPEPSERRPGFRSARFRLSRPAHLIALGAGSGLSPWAPGTVGTLWAWAVFLAVGDALDRQAWLIAIALAFVIGIWACGRTGREVGVSDHSAMVWDEVVAFWLVLALLPDEILMQVAGFLLFRFFDIVKPPPIRQFDARLKGGFGVMFDDLLAAGFTLVLLLGWERL